MMAAATVMIVLGALVITIGVLGWLGRLPRNRLAGVRTPTTLRSDSTFRVGNRAAGPATTLAGVLAIASGVTALLLPADDVASCVFVGAILLMVLVLIGAVQGVRAAGRTD
jgi:uncharacterized membrane protein